MAAGYSMSISMPSKEYFEMKDLQELMNLLLLA